MDLEEHNLEISADSPISNNPLLDLVEMSAKKKEKKKKRNRSEEKTKNALSDAQPRLETGVLREWQKSDRLTSILRPELISAKSGPRKKHRTFGVPNVNAEMASFFGTFFAEKSDEMDANNSFSPNKSSGRASSVEAARNDSFEKMNWEGEFFESENNDYSGGAEARFSAKFDPRLPSLSPGKAPGRQSVFSSENDSNPEDNFFLPVISADSADEENDVRTFQLKMLMRKEFKVCSDEKCAEIINFDSFTQSVKSRRGLAGTFYHILLLASIGQLKCVQNEPFSDIEISKTELF